MILLVLKRDKSVNDARIIYSSQFIYLAIRLMNFSLPIEQPFCRFEAFFVSLKNPCNFGVKNLAGDAVFNGV